MKHAVKSRTNLTIVKRFCGLAGDTTAAKRWKIGKSKVVASTSLYLLILDKKHCMNYTLKTPDLNIISSFDYVTTHDSRIAKKFVLFCKNMSIFVERASIATQMIIDHH